MSCRDLIMASRKTTCNTNNFSILTGFRDQVSGMISNRFPIYATILINQFSTIDHSGSEASPGVVISLSL